ncbi:MAG: dTDP-4-amino-4,6-dideoxygalactose transaminase [Gallionella sp.]|nr:dTDP-4-amino-4,6-dideoxygalactose transaminase [Gallionella sp.]MDP1939487.1 dTDP-4-amino-4,6-dideoxygalactose transaminase [Gallionella sp.]
MKPIPFNKPFIIGRELSLIADAVAQGHLSGDGAYTKLCHRWFEEKLGCRKALLTHSCTGALEMAAILCNIQPGDEVILPSYTFVSTANAFVLRGAVPVFVDIRPDTLNLDEELIEAAITPRTRVIVPVHYAGVPCEMDRIMAIAEKHRLLVVEDAAQALLSTYKGRALGSIGHFGCLSFHETKNIISGEGGALLVNDARFAERAEVIREKGTNRSQFFRGEVDKYTWMDIGSSYLPSELVSAFLYAQLERADEIIAKRRSICSAYAMQLAPLQQSGKLRIADFDDDSNGHLFYVLLDSLTTRSKLIAHLKAQGINPVFHYVPLHSSPAGRQYGREGSRMLVTDDLSERLLRLPLFYEMNAEDIARITAAIREFFID